MNPLQLAGSTLDEKIMASLERGTHNPFRPDTTNPNYIPKTRPKSKEEIRMSQAIERIAQEKKAEEERRFAALSPGEKYLYYSSMAEAGLDVASTGLNFVPYVGPVLQAIPDAIKLVGHSIPKAVIRRDFESLLDLGLDIGSVIPGAGDALMSFKHGRRYGVGKQAWKEAKEAVKAIKKQGVKKTVKDVVGGLVKEKAKEKVEELVENKANEVVGQYIANNIQDENLAGLAEITSGALIRGGIQGVKSKGSKKEAARGGADYIGEKVREDLISRIDAKNK